MERRPVWNFSRQPNKFGYLNNPNWLAKEDATNPHTPCGYWFRNPFPPPEPSGFYPAYKVVGGWVIAEWSNLNPIRFYPDDEVSLTWDYNYNTLYLSDYERIGDPDALDTITEFDTLHTNVVRDLSTITINGQVKQFGEYVRTYTRQIDKVGQFDWIDTQTTSASGETHIPEGGWTFSFTDPVPSTPDNFYYRVMKYIVLKEEWYLRENSDSTIDVHDDEVILDNTIECYGDRGLISTLKQSSYIDLRHVIHEPFPGPGTYLGLDITQTNGVPPEHLFESWGAKRRETFSLPGGPVHLNPLCRQQDPTTYTEPRYFCDAQAIQIIHEKHKMWLTSWGAGSGRFPPDNDQTYLLPGGYNEGIRYEYFETYNLYGPDTAVTYTFSPVPAGGHSGYPPHIYPEPFSAHIEILGHKSLTELRIVHISPYEAPWKEPIGEGIWPSNLWCAGSYDPPESWPQTTSAYIACYSSVDGSEIWFEEEFSTESEGVYTCYEYNRPFQLGDYIYYAREIRTGSGETWTTEISIVRRNATTGAFVNETAVLASAMISLTTDDYSTIVAYVDGVPKRYTDALVYVEDLTDPVIPTWKWAIDGVPGSATEVSTTTLWEWDDFEQWHVFHSEVLQPVPFIVGSVYTSYTTLEPIPYQPPPV